MHSLRNASDCWIPTPSLDMVWGGLGGQLSFKGCQNYWPKTICDTTLISVKLSCQARSPSLSCCSIQWAFSVLDARSQQGLPRYKDYEYSRKHMRHVFSAGVSRTILGFILLVFRCLVQGVPHNYTISLFHCLFAGFTYHFINPCRLGSRTKCCSVPAAASRAIAAKVARSLIGQPINLTAGRSKGRRTAIGNDELLVCIMDACEMTSISTGRFSFAIWKGHAWLQM